MQGHSDSELPRMGTTQLCCAACAVNIDNCVKLISLPGNTRGIGNGHLEWKRRKLLLFQYVLLATSSLII
jgi:hypothetical protein